MERTAGTERDFAKGIGRALPVAALALLSALPETLLASEQPRLQEATHVGGGIVATFREDRGHVVVLDVAGDYSFFESGGAPNIAARQAVSNEFLATHADEYDFLFVLTSFAVDLGPSVRARYVAIRNDVSGIGLDLFDHSAGFGSDGVLQGFVDLGALSRYSLDGSPAELESGLRIAAHEVLHRWGAYVRYRDGEGMLRTDLTSSGGHWSYLAQTDASLLYGNHWRDESDGTFRSIDAVKIASALDLYLAGFLGADEVPPFFLIRNPAVDPATPPNLGDVVSGSRDPITVADIVAAEGPRLPDAASAQHEFRAALVYLARPGESVDEATLADLDSLRRELISRFAVLTVGRGRLEIHPVAAGGPEPGDPDPIDGGPIRPGPADLDDAGDWLVSRQLVDGSWSDREGTRTRDTGAAARALRTAGRGFDLAAARSWAIAAEASSLDGRARLVELNTKLDQTPEALAERAAIGARQNADGGWGAAERYGSDPLDTALALNAYPTGHDAAAALAALLAAQNTDGSWGTVATGAGSVLATVESVRGLLRLGQLGAAEEGLAWLSAQQNPDGGFGDSPSTAHATAEVLLLLREHGRLDRIDAPEAHGYLRARQTLDGSWEGSVYSTARALEALLADQNPDWVVSAPSAEPDEPSAGEPVTLRVRVRNGGGSPLPAGIVRIHDGDPGAGGAVLGVDRPIPPLAAGAETEVVALWPEASPEGEHILHFVVDPDATVVEGDESNNVATLPLVVGPALAGSDLELRSDGIAFTPAQPNLLPSTVTITVTLANRGTDPVANARVRLWRGEVDSGTVVGEQVVPVGAGSAVPVHFPVEITSPGPTRFTAVADPDDELEETREENNRAARDLVTAPSLDIEILATDIALLDPPYPGADVRFAVNVRNRGTLGTPSFEVRYEILDDGEVIPVDSADLGIAPGATISRTILWRVSSAGALEFRVILDPEGELAELDETNNSASLPFVAGAPDVPNFVVSYVDLDFAPEPALEGSAFTASILVRNSGGVESPPFEVAFYDGDPDNGGGLLGLEVAGALPPGASTPVSFVWGSVPDPGDRFLHVVVDPSDLVGELEEDDNRAFRRLDVLALPDAALAPGAVSVSPAFPVPGQTVAIAIEATNLGEQPLVGLTGRVSLGDPESGGVVIAPDVTFATIPGGEGRIAQLSFTFPEAIGEAELVVRLDAAGAIVEADEGNNFASVSLSVQDADAFVTERYISPNGDGVRDETLFSFRLEEPATVAIEVRDRWGSVVRRAIDGLWTEVETGSFLWNGRSDLGRVVRDGDYSLTVVSDDGFDLGQSFVTVDTNRSSLVEAAGTPYESIVNLTCTIPAPRPWRPQFTADERSAFLLFDWGVPNQPVGIYRMDGKGGALQTVLGPDWFAPGVPDLPDSPGQLWPSDSGAFVAFSQSLCACGNCLQCGGGETRLLLTTASGVDTRELPLSEDSSIVGFLDGDREILAIEGATGALVTLATGAATPPNEVYAPDGFVNEAFLSPDRRHAVVRVVLAEDERFELVDLETGQGRPLVADSFQGTSPVWSRDGALFLLYDESGGRVLSVGISGQVLFALPIPESPTDGATIWDVEPLGYSTWNDEMAVAVARQSQAGIWLEYFVANLTSGEVRFLGASEPQNAKVLGSSLRGSRSRSEVGGHRGRSEERETGTSANTLAPFDQLVPADAEEPFFWRTEAGPWVPNDRALFAVSGSLRRQLFAFGLDPQAEPRELLSEFDSILDSSPSPTGRRLLFETWDPSEDSESACFDSGPDTLAVSNWLNLGTELVARRVPGVSGVLLSGAAADRSFARHRLEYAPATGQPLWTPIAPPSTREVFGEEFQTWIPPGPGAFLVRLTTEDRAGNVRSATQRVYSSETPILTDLNVSPEEFSPNGDGVRDTATIAYRLLEPANLEFTIVDVAGSVKRTFSRSLPASGEYSFVWDGRDLAALRVADGEYRVRVLDYEQLVWVDTTPPGLPPIVLNRENVCGSDGIAGTGRHLNVTYDIRPILPALPPGTFIERGLAPTPANWEGASSTGIPFRDAANYLFRAVVEDPSGNRAESQALPPGPFAYLGAASEQPSGVPIGFPGQAMCPPSPMGPDRRVVVPDNGLLRLELLESIPGALTVDLIRVESRPVGGCAGTLDTLATFEPLATYAIGQSIPWGSPAPDQAFELLWNAAALSPGGYCVRLEGHIDAAETWRSNRLEVNVDAAQTSLDLGPPTPEGRLAQELSPSGDLYRAAVAAGAFQPGSALFYVGEIQGDEPVSNIELVVESDEDPRFTLPQRFAPVFGAANRLLLRQPLWEPCTRYTAHLEGNRSEPGGGSTSISSPVVSTTTDCLSVDSTVRPDWASACGGTPSGDLLFDLTPRLRSASTGLSLLTIGRVLPGGAEELWMSWNQPAAGSSLQYRLDTSDLAEGEHRYRVRLTNVLGQEVIETGRFVVLRSPPPVELVHPIEGQQLCAADAELRWVAGGGPEIQCVSAVSPSPNCGEDNPLFTTCGPPRGWPPPALSRCGSGRASIPLRHGPQEVHFEAVGWSGHLSCAVRTIEIDGASEGSAALLGPSLISPNGDSRLDSTSLVVTVAETMLVRAGLYPAVRAANEWVVSGAEVRRLIDDVTVLDSLVVEWSGEDDDGVAVPDGNYLIVVDQRDGCANRSSKSLLVQVDTTPPALDLLYPRAGDPLPMLVNVHAAIADLHPGSFQLFFGAGADPATWTILAAGQGELPDPIIGTWNTFGLAGPFTLRLVAEDAAANPAEERETLLLDAPFRLFSYLEAVPTLFSPNGDGRREESAIRFGTEVDAVVSARIARPDGALVRQLLTAQSMGPGAQLAAWNGTAAGDAPAPDGEYRVELEAALAANPNVTQSEWIQVVVDRTPPAISITRPSGGFVAGTGSALGTIFDRHLAQYSVELAADSASGPWAEIDAGAANRQNAPLGSLEGLDEGDYWLRVRAEDLAETRIEQITPFVVDNTSPIATLESPVAESIHSAQSGLIEIRGAVVERYPASWKLEFGAGESPGAWTEIAGGAGSPAVPLLAAWSIAGLPDGLHTLRFTALDRAGQSGVATVRVRIDSTPPVASILSPAPDAYIRTQGPIVGSATDATLLGYTLGLAPEGSPLFSEIGRGATPVSAGTLGSWSVLPPDGRYRLRLDVVDQAGNSARAESAVTVDATPPAAPTLQATLEAGDDARLHWSASPEPDVIGYELDCDGVTLPGAPIVATTFLDPDLGDGVHRYVVRAVDRAGWRSAPSNEASIAVDRTPPIVRILAPSRGARISGLVEIVGTATSANDFRELRLFATPLAGGPTQLLARSNETVEGETVVFWSTSSFAEESQHRLRLEADDDAGNVAVDEVDVTVDNLAPAPPTDLIASVPGGSNDVALSWSPSTSPDVDGYLLYRDGSLVNAAGGAPGDLRAFLLRDSAYLDPSRPDGTFTYLVLAMDFAENLSAPSNEATATVSLQAPHLAIVEPADGSTIEGAVQVLATTPDEDVVEARFQWRALGGSTWTDLGSVDTDAPWTAIFDPAFLEPPLPFGEYELQAVALDSTGLSDPGPTPIRVIYTELAAPAAPTGVVASVDGGSVTLTWVEADEADLEGYAVERSEGDDESWSRLTPAPIPDATYLDSGLGDASYRYRVLAIDTVGNESLPSGEAPALVHTPRLRQPYTPTEARQTSLTGRSIGQAIAEVVITNAAGSSEPQTVPTDAEGRFQFVGLILAVGDNALTIRVSDPAGNRSRSATLFVWSGDRPSAPTGLGATPGAGAHEVVLAWTGNPEPDLLGYRVRRNATELPPVAASPALSATASSAEIGTPADAVDGDAGSYWAPAQGVEPIAGQWLEVAWGELSLVERLDVRWHVQDGTGYPAAAFDLLGWDGRAWVPLAEVSDNAANELQIELPRPYRTDRIRLELVASPPPDGSFVALAELAVAVLPTIAGTEWGEVAPDGSHAYAVTAWNLLGFESEPSAPATIDVGDIEPPLPVVLTALANGGNAELSWSASASPDVAKYELFRDGSLFAEHTDLENRVAVDAGLDNGTYLYAVRPVDAAGHAGELSNEVAVTIDVAPLPIAFELTVAEVAVGGALDLAWQEPATGPPAAYRLFRALEPGGARTLLAELSTRLHRDQGLTNGVTYFYEVVAFDGAGSALSRSNEASGTPRDAVALPPTLDFPTIPGIPIDWRTLSAPVAGSAEAGAAVTIYRNGAWVGVTTALAGDERSAVELPGTVEELRASPDGRAWLWSDGAGEAHLTTASGETVAVDDRRARWSPGGRTLWTVGAGGGGLAELELDGRVRRTIGLDGTAAFVVPAPDDRALAVGMVGATTWGVHRLDLGTGALTLLHEIDPWSLDGGFVDWSPDGEALAFLTGDWPRGVAVVHLDEAGPWSEVVDLEASDARPVWTPGGERLYWTSRATGTDQIWSWDRSTGATEAITDSADGRFGAQVSPDGAKLAMVDWNGRLYVRDLASGEESVLHDYGADFSWPRLDWCRSGELFALDSGDVTRFELAGRFRHPAIPLVGGENEIAARATDVAGNHSPPSESIELAVPSGAAPDLAILPSDLAHWPQAPTAASIVTISVTVRNLGAVASPPSVLRLLLRTPDGASMPVQSAWPLAPLAPGAMVTTGFDVELPASGGAYAILAAIDPGDLVRELDETNNHASRPLVVASLAGPEVTIVSDRPDYDAGATVSLAIGVTNAGPLFDGRLLVVVEDAEGFEVAPLVDRQIDDLPYGGVVSIAAAWSSGDVLAGAYQARARLLDGSGGTVSTGVAAFSLGEQFSLFATVETDRPSYPAGATVVVRASYDYPAGNAILTGVAARLRIVDSAGGTRREWTVPLGTLLPGSEGTIARNWSSAGATPGGFAAQVDLVRGGSQLATAASPFSLLAAPLRFSGTLVLAPSGPSLGEPVEASWSVTLEAGAPVANAVARISLIDPATGEVRESRDVEIALAPGASRSGVESFATAPLALRSYLVVLSFDPDGGAAGASATPVATAHFAPVDRTPPLLAIVRPVAGGLLGGSLEIVASSVDQHSSVERVEAQVDGAGWLRLNLLDAPSGLYGKSIPDLPEGPHMLRVRSRDDWGNVRESAEVPFEVDRTPPLIVVEGVTDGETYTTTVTPIVTVTDAHPGWTIVQLDQQSFESGGVVEELGVHALRVVAEDAADNRSDITVSFVLAPPPTPALALSKLAELVSDLDGDGVVSPGDVLEYRLDLASTGNAAATDIALVDPVPESTTLVPGSIVTNAGTIVGESPVTISIPSLSVGAVAEIRFRVAIAAEFPLTLLEVVNQAAVSASGIAQVGSDDPSTQDPLDPTRTAVYILPAISVADSEVEESAAAAEIAVTLSRPSNRATQVDFATADVTAEAGEDYETASGTITIPAGELGASVAVAILQDSAVEGPETFDLLLALPENGTLADSSARVTLLDDDLPTAVTVSDVEIEEGEAGSVIVSLSPPSETEIVLTFGTEAGTAEEGIDYTAAAGEVVVAPGVESVSIPLSTLEDFVDESLEQFALRLISATGGVLVDDLAIVTIADDDGPPSIEAAKSAAPADPAADRIHPGERLRYTIVVASTGASRLTQVRFTDTVHCLTTVVPGSVTTSVGTVSSENPVVVDVGTLDPGEAATIRVDVDVAAAIGDPPLDDTIVNQGTVSSDELPDRWTDDPTLDGSDDPTVVRIFGWTIFRDGFEDGGLVHWLWTDPILTTGFECGNTSRWSATVSPVAPGEIGEPVLFPLPGSVRRSE